MKKYFFNLKCFPKYYIYFDIEDLNLFAKLKVKKKKVLRKDEKTSSNALNYIKGSILFRMHVSLIKKSITNNTYYNCVYRKKIFKIKIYKILLC